MSRTVIQDYNAAVDFLDRNVAEGRGDKAAFIDSSRTLTYGELLDLAARVGPMLTRFGIEPENRIALVMLDTSEFPVVFWGAIRAGIIPIPLNTLLTADQYRYVFADSRVKAIFSSTEVLPVVLEALDHFRTPKVIIPVGGEPDDIARLDQLLKAEKYGSAPARTCADEVAYWLYSSGTTGDPKGVMHTHSTPMIVARAAGQRRIGFREDDVVFSAAKLFFSYGLSNSIFCPMSVGATSILYPGRPTPAAVFDLLRAHRPTMFYAVPTLYAAMLDDPRHGTDLGENRLRLCFSAGEPLPARIGEAWKTRFGLDVVNGVGSTEMGHLYLTNRSGAVEYGTAGVPVDGYAVKLVDEDGKDVGNDEVGELLVRGKSAAVGYWNQREKTRRTFEGAWTRTGDKYVRRPDGVYIYHGRSDDMFKVSGIWISPHEVEAALMTHPHILEAAVVPAQDGNGLIKPKAFVVLKGRLGSDERANLFEKLKAHVKCTIGPWKYPRWIEIVDALPKTTTGKTQRYLLRDTVASGCSPSVAAGMGG